jgi:hypothetical protein
MSKLRICNFSISIDGFGAGGSGEHLLAGLDLLELGYTCSSTINGANASHFVITK